jgi:hypothetical protein
VAHLRADVVLRTLGAVDDPKLGDEFLVRLRQIVVGGVGVAELGLSTGFGQLDGPQQCGEIRIGLQRSVEVPEHRALQIFGPLVDVLVERDLVDAALPFVRRDVAQCPGDGDLLLVGDVEPTEEDDSALLEDRADVRSFGAAQ